MHCPFRIAGLSIILLGLFWIQTLGQETPPSSLERIKEAYNRFHYTEVESLALQALETDPPPSSEEQAEIYTYMAFAHVALDKREKAIKNFERFIAYFFATFPREMIHEWDGDPSFFLEFNKTINRPKAEIIGQYIEDLWGQ